MASAVTVIFGANSMQFQAELAKMQMAANAAGRSISSGVGGHGPAGMTGMIRETAVIGREIAMGRGIGRILGSMSLLVMYLKSYLGTAKAVSAETGKTIMAFQRLALAQRLAAIAAVKKAEASVEAALAENLENESSITAANANWVKAKSELAEADAAEEKSAAIMLAAEAEEAEAIAAGEATAASLPLMAICLVIIVVLAGLYFAYKKVADIIQFKKQMEADAREITLENTSSVKDEIDALEKLAEAMRKTGDAFAQMNAEKNDFAEKSREAIQAMENEADAAAKLAEEKVKGKLLDIDIKEKSGQISKEDADAERLKIRTNALADEAESKSAALRDQATVAKMNAADAQRHSEEAQSAAYVSAHEAYQTPEAQDRAKKMAAGENSLRFYQKEVEEYAPKAAKETDPKMRAIYQQRSDSAVEGETMQAAINDILKSQMAPAELAAKQAMDDAKTKSEEAKGLAKDAEKAKLKADEYDKTYSSEVSAKQDNMVKQYELERIKDEQGKSKGYELNSQQRLGAYAATTPILTQQLAELRVIRANTTAQHGPSNQPPGHKMPQLGTRPSGGRHKNAISVSDGNLVVTP